MTLRSTRMGWLLALALLALSGCTIDLQHNLSEQDANDIYVLLTKNGIGVTKSREEGGNEPTYMIKVAKADAVQAAELLADAHLPRPTPGGWDNITKTVGMIPTATDERAKLLSAMGKEITTALNKIDGVLDTNATVNLPAESDLTQPDKKPPTTASVFIKYRALPDGKPPVSEEKIRAYVAGVLPEGKPENISVLMTAAQPVNMTSPELMFTSILGIQVANSSVGMFKALMGVVGALVLGMLGLVGFVLMRGPGESPAKGRPQRRRAPEE